MVETGNSPRAVSEHGILPSGITAHFLINMFAFLSIGTWRRCELVSTDWWVTPAPPPDCPFSTFSIVDPNAATDELLAWGATIGVSN